MPDNAGKRGGGKKREMKGNWRLGDGAVHCRPAWGRKERGKTGAQVMSLDPAGSKREGLKPGEEQEKRG